MHDGEHSKDDEILFDSTAGVTQTGRDDKKRMYPLRILHLKRCVDSTQDETKRLLRDFFKQQDSSDPSRTPILHISLAVLADDQSRGRGTSGRSWVATSGNLFFTYAIPFASIPMAKITLLPLAVGLLVAEALDQYLPPNHDDVRNNSKDCLVSVKWPNDVLLDGRKVAGTLIENARIVVDEDGNNDGPNKNGGDASYWLVGIGVNLSSYPTNLSVEPNSGQDATSTSSRSKPRPATSLSEYCSVVPTAVEFGVDLAQRIEELIRVEWGDDNYNHNSKNTSSHSRIVDRWRQWAQLGAMQTLRETGEVVQTIDIQSDGQLRVMGADGVERLLVSDYFV